MSHSQDFQLIAEFTVDHDERETAEKPVTGSVAINRSAIGCPRDLLQRCLQSYLKTHGRLGAAPKIPPIGTARLSHGCGVNVNPRTTHLHPRRSSAALPTRGLA